MPKFPSVRALRTRLARLARLGLGVVLAGFGLAVQAAGTISVQASASYQDANNLSFTVESNVVTASLADSPTTINFYNSSSYDQHAGASDLGSQLWGSVTALACNKDPTAIETITVSLYSLKTATSLSVTAVETGVDTGIFHFHLMPSGANMSSTTASPSAMSVVAWPAGMVPPWGSGTPPPGAPSGPPPPMDASKNDVLHATVAGCGGGSATTSVLIDPSGVVYDSGTDTPLGGATVTLIDVDGTGNGGNPGGPATVYANDGVTRSPSTVTTASDGVYTFPLVASSQYRLDVIPPTGYSYPSTLGPAAMPKERNTEVHGSFHLPFLVNPDTGAMLIDLPLDEMPHAMTVSKVASRTTAEIADSVGYTVVVRNVGTSPLDSVTLKDTLPTGFGYLGKSATVDNVAIDEPAGGKGPVLTFALPALAGGQTRTLRYRAMLGPLALNGDGVNRAQASAALPFATVSNVAAAKVQVQQGVFTDRAMVLGKVWADCNGNGLQDAGEPGVPGVRLVMEDGSFVVTDGKGQYSFYGISPRTHVLKIDATTLPSGTTPVATSSRNAGDGASRFVDPHNGELHRADFALSGCSNTLDTLIALRVNATSELSSALKMDFRADGGVQSTGDVRAHAASGLIGEAKGADGTRYVTVTAGADAGRNGTLITHEEAAPEPTLEQRVADLDNTLGFIDLRDGQALATTQATVRVKGSSEIQLSLSVDGKPVGDERVGTRVQDASRKIQARDYVGVPMPAGDHELSLTAKDPFGNVRGNAHIIVRAPGDLAHLAFTLPASSVQADGATRVPVTLALSDARGVPVLTRTAVTLDASLGDWDVKDLDPNAPGVQTFVEGGRAEFALRAPAAPGSADLRASSGPLFAKGTVSFVPALRPMIAAGIVEGAINLRKLSTSSIVASGSNDGFEQTLTSFANNGNDTANGRAALYLKGKVLGSSLLTIGYDSAKESNEALFRDIQPDQFYPVYGDSSTKGFDAQSTSHLYVRLEHDKSYVLYGDFTTQAVDPARQLGAYQRSLTGAKAHVEQGPLSATAWASQATSRQIIDELKANGTSGPFMLSSNSPAENSEKVEILVRDRNQPALIILSTTLARYTDYDLDVLTGRLLLRAPVASYDADLNPQSIRVTYESDTQGTRFLVTGADAKLKIGEKVEVGIALVMDKDPLDSMNMGSVNATFRPDDQTSITVEAARTTHDLEGRGDAQRVEFHHDDDKLKIAATAAHTDAEFDNPSSAVSKGRNEAALKASYGLDDKTRLVVDAASSGDAVTGDRRDGLLVGVERSLDGGAKLEVGARHVQSRPGSSDTSTTTAGDTSTVRAKLSAPIPGIAKATGFVEAEQDVHDADKRLLAVGGDYRVSPSARVYVREEIISSLSGELSLDATQRRNTTLVGVDSDVTQDTHLFSEYRVRDALDGRDSEAAIGLRNKWTLAEGLRLNTSFERVQQMAGGNGDDNLALTAAIEYSRDPLTKATGRIELREGSGSRGVLSTLGLARKISDDWTLLGRNAYALTESRTGGTSQLQERFQLGVAYRDTTTNRVNGLGRYEFKREDNGTDFERRAVHLISTHADLQVARGMLVTGEYAAKHVVELIEGRWVPGNAQLISLRAVRDLGERWDIGLAARVLGNSTFSQRTTNVGIELGYRAIENLWISLGYNLTGFRDRDLAEDTSTQLGAYVRMRFKFDEKLFAGATKGTP